MNNKAEKENKMQIDKILEMVKIIAERCDTKEEFLKEIQRVQDVDKKKPQSTD